MELKRENKEQTYVGKLESSRKKFFLIGCVGYSARYAYIVALQKKCVENMK